MVATPLLGHADSRDPLGVGRACLFHTTESPLPQDSLCSHRVDRETYLTAFFAWWICYFILPSDPRDVIRPLVFVMASALARGARLSLSVPVLANIYRGLRDLTSSRDPSGARVTFLLHLVNGWLHMHWRNLYICTLSADLRQRLPLLGDIAGSFIAGLDPVGARFHFHDSSFHVRESSARLNSSHTSRISTKLITDKVPTSGRGIRDHRDDIEYLISARCGFLPHRIGGHIAMEPYSPHRCAHQFGFDQDIPAFLTRPGALSIDTLGLHMCWDTLFRTGTGIRCHMVARPPRDAQCTVAYRGWFWKIAAPLQACVPPSVVEVTCP